MTQETTVEVVRIDNFIRFSSLYTEAHVRIKGTEPFHTGIRRAFNRFNKAAAIDKVTHYRANDLTSAFESEMTA